ncbi:MAG TPA: saccharopine dehydrogenase NADP-binding domain-containing protein [Aliidongia sp.]|nr:saccharopine dehydrogenase NADP-binding domain-containing protein [Aliidongia sp.]
MTGSLMIYGATGYTGKLLARVAKERGLAPILAGRSADRLKPVADALGFTWRAIDLADAAALDAGLADIDTVLHIAGPFSHTSRSMLDACLRTGTHYLDITGEIDVFEACAARDGEAQAAGIMVMPGVGFDVVPTDCLAAHLKSRLPDATELTLALGGLGHMSRGTAKTGIEGIAHGVRLRRAGKIVEGKTALRREIDFNEGPRRTVAVGWGDVSTAFHSTGIPDITVYFEATPQLDRMADLGPFGRWFLSRGPVQNWLKRWADRQPEGPSEAQRAAGRSEIVGEVANAAGERRRVRLTTPEGYSLTAMTGLEIARRVLNGAAVPGFQTPSRVFGADFITEIDGCERYDLNA